MFGSTPYSSIPDRYSPYLPEEFLPVWKIRRKRKAVFALRQTRYLYKIEEERRTVNPSRSK